MKVNNECESYILNINDDLFNNWWLLNPLCMPRTLFVSCSVEGVRLYSEFFTFSDNTWCWVLLVLQLGWGFISVTTKLLLLIKDLLAHDHHMRRSHGPKIIENDRWRPTSSQCFDRDGISSGSEYIDCCLQLTATGHWTASPAFEFDEAHHFTDMFQCL